MVIPLSLIVSVSLSLQLLVAAEKPNCLPEWTYFEHTKQCYHSFSATATYSKALANCRQFPYGDLVKIPDEQTNNFLSTLPGPAIFLIGCSSKDNGKTYEWTDGTPVNYSNWLATANGPNLCGSYIKLAKRAWYPASCDMSNSYLCQMLPLNAKKPETTKPPIKTPVCGDSESVFTVAVTTRMNQPRWINNDKYKAKNMYGVQYSCDLEAVMDDVDICNMKEVQQVAKGYGYTHMTLLEPQFPPYLLGDVFNNIEGILNVIKDAPADLFNVPFSAEDNKLPSMIVINDPQTMKYEKKYNHIVSQIMWSNATLLGCKVKMCKVDEKFPSVLACIFNEAPQVGQLAFEKGKLCQKNSDCTVFPNSTCPAVHYRKTSGRKLCFASFRPAKFDFFQ